MKPYKLKLFSKKLVSGRFQVKFELLKDENPAYYGYLLTESKTPLREVVEMIYQRAFEASSGDALHEHLFHLNKHSEPVERPVLFFKN